MVTNLPATAGDIRTTEGSLPGPGGPPGGGHSDPLLCCWLEDPVVREAGQATGQGSQRVRPDGSDLVCMHTSQ